MKKILSVFGTRPEAIKMAPLIKAIEAEPELENIVCVTGQHREMLQQVLDAFDIVPDINLELMGVNQSIVDIHSKVLQSVYEYLRDNPVDIVLVHGDTSTTFAAAQAAFYTKTPVGHVEAGLRTYDLYSPFPEEANRLLTGRLASLHFAPTQRNVDNLKKEGIKDEVFLTGNTVIDALQYTVSEGYEFKNEVLNSIDYDKKTIVVTAHRRENHGRPMEKICKAVCDLANNRSDIQFVFPVHLSPVVRETVFEYLSNINNVILIDPIEVFDMHNLMARSYIVLTDSGGLQEEAPSLGVPVLVLREETERPEAVDAGTVKVIGTNQNRIVREVTELLDNAQLYTKMSKAVNPYGDGNASSRIIDAILSYFQAN